jgi:hypothetical protein
MGKKLKVLFEASWYEGDSYFKTNDKRLVRKILKQRLKTVKEIIIYSQQLEDEAEQKQFEEG